MRMLTRRMKRKRRMKPAQLAVLEPQPVIVNVLCQPAPVFSAPLLRVVPVILPRLHLYQVRTRAGDTWD
jgi:hypothetical protein